MSLFVNAMPSAHRPAVSVIMPVYNVERFVERAVRSVLDRPQSLSLELRY